MVLVRADIHVQAVHLMKKSCDPYNISLWRYFFCINIVKECCYIPDEGRQLFVELWLPMLICLQNWFCCTVSIRITTSFSLILLWIYYQFQARKEHNHYQVKHGPKSKQKTHVCLEHVNVVRFQSNFILLFHLHFCSKFLVYLD